jgi:outer membrane protein OmpA-like peptidoglycan-associated protein
MKTLITSAVLLTLASGTALAAGSQPTEAQENGRAGIIIGNTIAGALLAGPVGAFAGFGAGYWLGDKYVASAGAEVTKTELAEVQAENDALYQQFAMLNVENVELQNLAAASLEFQVLFRTGDSALTAEGEARIERLAGFLAQQDSLQVQLSGFADPRGDDVYNESLSQQRLDSITAILTANGIEASRISAEAFGDRLSLATEGDLDAYALERRVSIELLPDVSSTSVAAR